MKNIIEANHISKHYQVGDTIIKAVDDVNLTILRREFVAIVGKSGSGKSTLVNLLSGLDTLTSGTIVINNIDISELSEREATKFRREHIGFVFQAYNLVPVLNVWENIVLPIGLNGEKPDKKFIECIMADLGIQDKNNAFPNMLSGGQQQRVAIARALASKPSIILADEPTGNLDSKTSDEVMTLLTNTVEKYNQTLVIITHDNDIAKMANRVLVMNDGRIRL